MEDVKVKGNSKCHIFSEQGRDNYDSIFGKNKVAEAQLEGTKAGARLKGTLAVVDSSVPPIRKTNKIGETE